MTVASKLKKATTKRNKHGMYKTRLYRIWLNIKLRCYYPCNMGYKNYGAKGITMIEEWHEFIPFMEWAFNNGYQDNLVIDRIDSKGKYEPSNCRWITQRENLNNRSNTIFVTKDGETKPLSIWADMLGINYNTLSTRYKEGDRGEVLLRPLGITKKRWLNANAN